MKYITLSTLIVAAMAISSQAAQLAPESVAPAKRRISWDGPEIKTKREQETKVKAAAAAATAVALTTHKNTFFSENDPFIQQIPHELLKVITDYIPEFHPFVCSREFIVPGLGPKKIKPDTYFQSGMCAQFTDKDNVRVYIVEGKTPGHFKLFDQYGKERAYCTAHAKELSKIMVMPSDKKRPYTFVTASRNGEIRFWNEEGKEVKYLGFQPGVCDFDIALDVNVNEKLYDVLVVAVGEGMEIPCYDITSLDNVMRFAIQGWGNLGAHRVKLLSSAHGLTLVTCEAEMKSGAIGDIRKRQGLCLYDAVKRQMIGVNDHFSSTITCMDSLYCDDKHSFILVGHTEGIVQAYMLYNSADNSSDLSDPCFVKQMADKNPIIGLKAYCDDAREAHVMVQTLGSKNISDINIRKDDAQVITPNTKKPFYMGFGLDAQNKPIVLTCAPDNGCVQEWTKDTNPFNKTLLKGPQKPKPITVELLELPKLEKEPKSKVCVIM